MPNKFISRVIDEDIRILCQWGSIPKHNKKMIQVCYLNVTDLFKDLLNLNGKYNISTQQGPR